MNTSIKIFSILACLALGADALGQQTVQRLRPPAAASRVQRVNHVGATIAQVGCNSCGGNVSEAIESSSSCGNGSCGESCGDSSCSSCSSCTSGCNVRYGVPALNCQYMPRPECWCRPNCMAVTGCDPCCRTIFDEMICDVKDFFGNLHGASLRPSCTSSMDCVVGCTSDCGSGACCGSRRGRMMFPVPARSCAMDWSCGCASTACCDTTSSCCSTDVGCCDMSCGNGPCFQELLCDDAVCARPSLFGSLGNLLFGPRCEVACNDAWGCTESCSVSNCDPGCGCEGGTVVTPGCDSCAARTNQPQAIASRPSGVRSHVARNASMPTMTYSSPSHQGPYLTGPSNTAPSYSVRPTNTTQVARNPSVRRISHPSAGHSMR